MQASFLQTPQQLAFLRLKVKICQFFRLTAKLLGRFMPNGEPDREPLRGV